VHTYIENEVMYPEVRKLLPDLEDDVLESYEEHHVADVLCVELAAMSPTDERFDAKTTVLIENVKHHMEEEESDWFPKVREGLGRNQLQDIGARMLKMKEKAPQVNVAVTANESIFKNIKLPGGISTKATEFKDLAAKGEKWESPVFSIGSAKETSSLPKIPAVTRKPHTTGQPSHATNGFTHEVNRAFGSDNEKIGGINGQNTQLGQNNPVLQGSV